MRNWLKKTKEKLILKNSLANLLIFYFNNRDELKLEEFVRITNKITRRISFDEAENFFKFIDLDYNENVDSLEFKAIFDAEEWKTFEKSEIDLPKKMEDEIKELFDKVDEDKSGYIDREELGGLL